MVSIWLFVLSLSAHAAEYDPAALARIDERVVAVARDGGVPVVVFDLDDTLIDARERNERILADLAADSAARERFPAETAALHGLGHDDVAYLLKDTLATVGIASPEFLDAASGYWGARFFTSAYCADDRPNPGAVPYARRLAAHGARVIYLTGRDRPRMGEGTVASLRALGFPGPGSGAELLMKPSPEGDDLAFKISQFAAVAAAGSEVVAAFENEPANINAFQRGFPRADMVFVDTIHSPKPDLPNDGISWVRDFETGDMMRP